MRSPLGCLTLLQLVVLATTEAQSRSAPVPGAWSVGVSVGAAVFGGATSGTGPNGEELAFIPYRPTLWGVAITYGKARGRVGVSARYGEPGLGVRGVPISENQEPVPGLLLVAENAYKLGLFTATVSTRLLRLRGGPSVRPSLGLELERWSAPGSPVRTIAGGQAGLAMEVALSGAFVASLDGELGFTPGSPFRRADLPEGFRPRSTWRRSLAAALYWRF